MPTTQDGLRALVLELIGDIAPDADVATLDPSDSMQDQLGMDSMDFLNLVTALHDRLGVNIPERDYPKLASLDDAVAYLAARS